MIRGCFREKWFSSRRMYISNIANIIPKWSDICNIADIPKLGDILLVDSKNGKRL